MKLGELRAAVRKHKGVVMARAELAGIVVDIPVQKTAFLSMLDAYGENKVTETGLTFTDGGIVTAPELVNAQLDSGAEMARQSEADIDLMEGSPSDMNLPGGDDLLGGGSDLLGEGSPSDIDLLG